MEKLTEDEIKQVRKLLNRSDEVFEGADKMFAEADKMFEDADKLFEHSDTLIVMAKRKQAVAIVSASIKAKAGWIVGVISAVAFLYNHFVDYIKTLVN